MDARMHRENLSRFVAPEDTVVPIFPPIAAVLDRFCARGGKSPIGRATYDLY